MWNVRNNWSQCRYSAESENKLLSVLTLTFCFTKKIFIRPNCNFKDSMGSVNFNTPTPAKIYYWNGTVIFIWTKKTCCHIFHRYNIHHNHINKNLQLHPISLTFIPQCPLNTLYEIMSSIVTQPVQYIPLTCRTQIL